MSTQLFLTFSPEFLQEHEGYLSNEANIKFFFNQIQLIAFNDNCSFLYSPDSCKELLVFFEKNHEGYYKALLNFLNSKNVEEVKIPTTGSATLFQYQGYGQFVPIIKGEALFYLYEKDHVALVDFSNRPNNNKIRIILDESGRLKCPKEWPLLSTFTAFIDWVFKILPRSFDEKMSVKHQSGGKKGFGSDILCDIDEAKRVLRISFYKKLHHEVGLFFYHIPKTEKPVLFFKSSDNSVFHGYHISEQEAKNKGVDTELLLNLSNYVNSFGNSYEI